MRLYVAFNAPIRDETAKVHYNEDNNIQNFDLGRYIAGYTFGNHVLRLRSRVAVKLNFRPYIRRYTSPNENFKYSYPLIVLLKYCYTFLYRWDVLILPCLIFQVEDEGDEVIIEGIQEEEEGEDEE